MIVSEGPVSQVKAGFSLLCLNPVTGFVLGDGSAQTEVRLLDALRSCTQDQQLFVFPG